MKVICPNCHVSITINETNYPAGSRINYTCPVCGHPLAIDIPSRIEQPAAPVQPMPQPNSQAVAYNQPIVNGQIVTPNHVSAKPMRPVGPPPSSISADKTYEDDEAESHHSPLIWIIPLIVLLLCGGIGGYFYYEKVYLPAKIDREAPRYYTISNATNLRSSKMAGADYNHLKTVPYGSELITYEHDNDWSSVKDNQGVKGYISSVYLVNKSDFLLLNSIFGDAASRMNIETVKCRRALLNYFKDHGYIGKVSSSDLSLITPAVHPNNQNQWQVFCRAKGVKPNSVYFDRITNPNSKFTDFAVIIRNIVTNEHKLLIFTFADDETPSLVYEENTDANYIYNIYMYGDEYEVEYAY